MTIHAQRVAREEIIRRGRTDARQFAWNTG